MERLSGRIAVALWSFVIAACGSVQSRTDAGDDALPMSSFASCAGMMKTCGAGGNDDCCRSLMVPGGSYDRGYDLAGDGSSGDANNPAKVSEFRLDKYEVTVGRFRKFVNAGMGTQANPPAPGAGAHATITQSGWNVAWSANLAQNTTDLMKALSCTTDSTSTWTDTPGDPDGEHRPINCVTWYDAMAFCIWDGGYLPTEAEWNHGAAGGDQQRAYPWSNPPGSTAIDAMHASYKDATGCVGNGMPDCSVTDLVPVGTKPLGDGRWGQSDMAGNVWEWALDLIGAYPNPCTDCANTTSGTNRVRRGGSFVLDPTKSRTTARDNISPSIRFNGSGVRCARAP